MVTLNSIHLFIFFCHWQYKIRLVITENFISDEDSIPVVITTAKKVNSILKGYHALKDLWKAFINEELPLQWSQTMSLINTQFV